MDDNFCEDFQNLLALLFMNYDFLLQTLYILPMLQGLLLSTVRLQGVPVCVLQRGDVMVGGWVGGRSKRKRDYFKVFKGSG